MARWVKRGVDLLGASLLAALLAPVAVGIAAVVKATTAGPVLFRQVRIGQHERPFVLMKFRTMSVDAEAARERLVALSRDPNWLDLEDDPRITPVGRVLRRTSLDEVPQLWNVLRGDMSLVGPRPLIASEHERLPDWARARVEVPSGVTGLWQVSGRTTIPFEGMLVLDRTYVANCSLRADLHILLRTVPAVLSGKGAN